uniref:ACPS domain-containing protein n=1 Tax=Haemonchus contortus TaxID=6289 RepID=A0A7I4Y0C7_HAECO
MYNVAVSANDIAIKLLSKYAERRCAVSFCLPRDVRRAKKVYDEDLAIKAHKGEIGGPLSVLEGNSTFERTWEETIERALSSSLSKGKANVAKKIGCEIKLATSTTDGSHNVEFYCRLGDK